MLPSDHHHEHGTTAAIVGLGQLGELLARRVRVPRLLLISGRPEHARTLAAEIPRAEAATAGQLREAHIVCLALPAHALIAAYRELAPQLRPDVLLLNPATMLDTDEARAAGSHEWTACKLLGSVKALADGGTGLVVTDSEQARLRLEPLLTPLGPVTTGEEHWVRDCNTIATCAALEAALRIADGIRALGLPDSFAYTAQTMVARGVIQSYADGTLGHFARDILAQVLRERR
ncbi:hypothetical protein IDH44_07105 [Paenibacillus sp. IB182496]|uniref:Pyrroline-5-carboxylate reductase catalytic N-terminal domain-containing protein n=1 Tax=Paenibacillus sabuli TaxID=2772509 RepID=A0A927GRR5_9BACL|nr:hypothetical protein [Paenibacillus sabuli]MBD2844952.1 hypothetical protein [Paenibacillus sabuli]